MMFAFVLDGHGAMNWLSTFAVHSTLVLAGAWLVSVLLRQRALALQENLLRFSLWAALVSTTLQCTLLEGEWTRGLVLPAASSPKSLATIDLTTPASLADVAAFLDEPSWWSQLPWPSLLFFVAVGAATLGLGWLLLVHRRLHAVLLARQPETDPRVLSTAAEVAHALGLQQSPHVSRSDRITTPIAFGLMRPEICLPVRVSELGDASLRAMLAHEVAHLRAADPAWMWGAAWLQALFPWQFLLVAVRRRWARLVELRCDAIAAEQATPTAVARCLLDVADWLRPETPRTVVALGMAARPSALRERVEAALRGAGFRPARRRVTGMLSALTLSALTFAAPGVEFAAAPAMPQPAAAEAPTPMVRAALQHLRVAVEREQTHLAVEAALVRSELRGQLLTPELAQLQATIDRRLDDLTRMQARLAALLSRTDSEDR